MKILKNDKVYIISGKDKGKTGEVSRALPKSGQVIVAGLNIVKKAVKPSKKNPAGGIIEVAKPLPISNVALVCAKCGKPTRVAYLIAKDGKKSRVCKKCQAVVKE